jgi:diguanylate cyclase (GGDEF)-like protein/PAS domain S-box-containing protein
MINRRPFKLTAAAAYTLGAGLSITAVLFGAVGALEYSKMQLAFEQRADQRTAAIQSGLNDAVEVLAVTNQLFVASAPVSRSQFQTFTAPLLQRYPFIQAFNYHRWLEDAARPAFEAQMRREFPGYAIREMADGQPVTAPRKAHYSVVEYLEPMAGNERAFGLDAGYRPEIRLAMEEVLRTGKPASTGLLPLAQATGKEHGLIMLMPVYRPGMPLDDYGQRQEAWQGDTAIVIRATTLVRKILEADGLLQDYDALLQVRVADGLVFSHGAVQESADTAPVRWLSWQQRSDYRKQFTVLGKEWEVRINALPRPFLADHIGSISTLAGGILSSLLMAAFVQSLVLRSRRVQMLVDARTAELRQSNERLNADVLARKRTERALLDSEQRFRRLLALSSDWYWEQDANLRFTSITGGFFDKGHIRPERFIGKTRWDATPGLQATRWGRDHMARLEARLPFSHFEYAIEGDDGVLRWYSTSGEPVYDAKGEFKGYRGTGAEITERKLSEQRIHHIAHHDALTGLPNRMLLQDRLAQAIAYANRSGHHMWVLLIDLDRFKFVNDSLGHKAGDILLKTVAQRLSGSVRESDTVARLSGDEFVAILSESNDAPLTPDVVQRVMNAVAQPVMLEGKEFLVTCSIGVAAYDGSVGDEAQHLIEHADIAMYAAKKQGRNGFRFYLPCMNEEALERLRIENALRNALARGEFMLHYQPQADLGDGAITGVEALLRWQHPEMGVVAPDRFIGLAEETGLIVPIGMWALQSACAQGKAWNDWRAAHGQPPLRIAVNLSARQFMQPSLASHVAQVLEETGLPPACLELELTESVFMNDVNQAATLLHGLKALGVTLSIDDFGTGYSSLSYLRSFPIDVLKIDRSFVNDIATDADDEAIVVSIIALAHNLKLRVVAEGVESREQLEYLRRHGCDQIQGYYFSRPVAPLQFEQMLRENKHLGWAELAPLAWMEAGTGT